MTDETLISFDSLEAEEELRTSPQREGFSLAIVERELVLICSLVLRASEIILGDPKTYVHPQTATDNYNRIWRSFFTHSDTRNRLLGTKLPSPYLGEESLPDVCGRCFRTIGFCASGRVRSRCSICYSHEDEAYPASLHYLSRCLYPHRICSDSLLVNAIFAQLIHKYYSPNGDPTWKMRSLMS